MAAVPLRGTIFLNSAPSCAGADSQTGGGLRGRSRICKTWRGKGEEWRGVSRVGGRDAGGGAHKRARAPYVSPEKGKGEKSGAAVIEVRDFAGAEGAVVDAGIVDGAVERVTAAVGMNADMFTCIRCFQGRRGGRTVAGFDAVHVKMDVGSVVSSGQKVPLVRI